MALSVSHNPDTTFDRRGHAEESPAADWRRLLVGASPALRRTTEIIELVAARRSTVLITGETGTGKEVVARALHQASPRSAQPMVTVNAAALPESLLEAELFGHVKGAFTGAVGHRIGRFEQAHRSTLFLDEIGDLPLDMQTKLLRFLQEREIQRVGSSETLHVDVRLIAATNVNLAERVREGKFREDLFYRLNVVPIETPPLRDRLEDIPALAGHFLKKICAQEEIPLREIRSEALTKLEDYPWPGNVRQLENAIEKAVALSGERLLLGTEDFDLTQNDGMAARQGAFLGDVLEQVPGILTAPDAAGSSAQEVLALEIPRTGLDFERLMSGIEARILGEALRQTQGNKTAAADLLRLKRTTLAAKLRALGIADEENQRAAAAGL